MDPEIDLQEVDDVAAHRDKPIKESGFIKFYGLYWRKDCILWDDGKLLGQPEKWLGSGRKNFEKSEIQMNFWNQKGVYILYDHLMNPVYAGQAGLVRKKESEGSNIGTRLRFHSSGVYRNGWSLFSWFGFLDTKKLNLRTASEEERLRPVWDFPENSNSNFNNILASFEAILIEGFAPRFNARGGDLGKAIFVDQYEPKPDNQK